MKQKLRSPERLVVAYIEVATTAAPETIGYVGCTVVDDQHQSMVTTAPGDSTRPATSRRSRNPVARAEAGTGSRARWHRSRDHQEAGAEPAAGRHPRIDDRTAAGQVPGNRECEGEPAEDREGDDEGRVEPLVRSPHQEPALVLRNIIQTWRTVAVRPLMQRVEAGAGAGAPGFTERTMAS